MVRPEMACSPLRPGCCPTCPFSVERHNHPGFPSPLVPSEEICTGALAEFAELRVPGYLCRLEVLPSLEATFPFGFALVFFGAFS